MTWTSHDASRLGSGEYMISSKNYTENAVTYYLRGLRYVLNLSLSLKCNGRDKLSFLVIYFFIDIIHVMQYVKRKKKRKTKQKKAIKAVNRWLRSLQYN